MKKQFLNIAGWKGKRVMSVAFAAAVLGSGPVAGVAGTTAGAQTVASEPLKGGASALPLLSGVTSLPVTEVKGIKNFYYDVQARESIYGVAEKLGVTREAILEHNPSAADGLKPHMRLFFPVDEFTRVPVGSKAIYSAAAGVKTHIVKKGETLYGIARKYGMSADRLAEMNPHVADGLRAGDTLTINGDERTECPEPGNDMAIVDGDGYAVYEIKEGETLFSIASRYNVPLEAVLEANPEIDPLRYSAGQTVRVPIGQTAEKYAGESVAVDTANEYDLPEKIENNNDLTYGAGVTDGEPAADNGALLPADSDDESDLSEPMEVAVLLPFMLGDQQQSRTTQLYTEFYKGMLMAVDSLRNAPGAPVNFRFFDTASNLDSVRSVLARPEVENADLVVAPDNPSQLSLIMESVSPETLVLNIFAVKDESYKNYRNLIQTNIPHDAMYDKAIAMFMDKYEGVTPVFISRSEGQADKDSFTSELKKKLDEAGRPYREIVFDISLGDSDLEGLDVDAQPVVFVPNSGSKTEFARFVKTLIRLRDNAAVADNVTVFGYPEWVTFRGESFDEICALDATIYSRYLADDNDAATRELKDRYREWYGVDMFEAVPTQGILGFDTGMYIIKGLKDLDATGVFPSENTGVQSNMKLSWSGNAETDASGELSNRGGLVNEALYLINYRPGGRVEWKN
ncbi:MAG: LysM peptidoglycan-binding domain-containing protein [Muribaculaceae bacterium]|nr:LysM peptidoglycan-binding domain-containing protein [Muribaculaceae bacterium]